MIFAQSYTRATQSNNLRCDEYHSDTDKLAAAALSGVLGGMLFRVKFGNDATTYAALLEKWVEIVTKKASHRQWPKHVTARKVAGASLDYWLNDICLVCGGKCYKHKRDNPDILTEALCDTCKGSGKKPLVCEENWRKFIGDMVDELEDMARSAARAAMKKLSSEMDL